MMKYEDTKKGTANTNRAIPPPPSGCVAGMTPEEQAAWKREFKEFTSAISRHVEEKYTDERVELLWDRLQGLPPGTTTKARLASEQP